MKEIQAFIIRKRVYLVMENKKEMIMIKINLKALLKLIIRKILVLIVFQQVECNKMKILLLKMNQLMKIIKILKVFN